MSAAGGISKVPSQYCLNALWLNIYLMSRYFSVLTFGRAIDAGAELCKRCESWMIWCFSASDSGELTTSRNRFRNVSFSSDNFCISLLLLSWILCGKYNGTEMWKWIRSALWKICFYFFFVYGRDIRYASMCTFAISCLRLIDWNLIPRVDKAERRSL